MLKREWKRLLKNKVMLVVMIAIIAIPTIYTTLFLGSMWDPYGNLEKLPVAVVNKDKAVTYENDVMNIGEDLVENLKENDSLAFNFVEDEIAQRGLENGTYYMVITIPEDFSMNATTLLDQDPKKMELLYATNPGTNYIASKMSETALSKIKDTISAKVTEVYAKNMFTDIAKVGDGMTLAADGSNEILDGVNKVSDGVVEYTDGVEKLTSGSKELSAKNDSLNQGITDLSEGVNRLSDGSKQLYDGLSTMSNTIGDTLPNQKDITALENGLDTYSNGISQLNSELSKFSVSESSTAIAGSLQNIGTKVQDAAVNTQSIANAIAQLSATNLTPAQLASLQTIMASTKAIGDDLTTIGTETQSVGTNFSSLASSMGKLDELKSAVSTLSENTDLVFGGSKTAISGLYTGMNQLKNTLDETVIPGANTLNKGLLKLNNNINKESGLKSGVNQYTSAVSEITTGLITLNENSYELKDGMKKLADGASELSSKLNDGATEVNEISSNDKTIDMFVSPVESNEMLITTVRNNGHAMAPYMMSVALWVACIALCIMYPLTEYEGELKSGLSWWLSKASVIFPVSILQALVMVFMLYHINGFHPYDLKRTILIACLSSFAFMAVMYFFNVWLGKVGSFIMLIFMVVQLAGAAGTYPMEISGEFVTKIHKYLPFSYTVEAFRRTISGGQSISHAIIILSIIFVVFTALTIGMFQFRAKRIKAGKVVLIDLLTNEGLA